ncbi:MAG TPA: hypothetical protein VFX44_04525 [Solirubrobacterales bacterium]|nr:hypothetical protein [Solirubrobacterales bacterium]
MSLLELAPVKRPKRIPVAISLAALAAAVLLASCGGASDTTSTETTAGSKKSVTVVPESGLLKAMKGVGYPVYWAGPRLGVAYEVQRQEGRTFVRYLPKGEEPGSEKTFLTVGSYEDRNALAGVRESGQKPGAVLVKIDGGGTAYAESTDATSAYMAFPGVDTQVEVFDPKAGEALRLIRSGAIVPVGS